MTGGPRFRIAHVTATFPPYCGGTGNVAWHNARELARLGHEVHVFTAGPGVLGGSGGPAEGPAERTERTAGEAPDGVRVHRLRPVVRVGNAPLLAGLFPALRRFDLVHLHYPFYFGAEMVLAASRAFGVPYVITYHNDVQLNGRLASLPRVHHWLIGRRVLAGAQRLLFTTRDYGAMSYAAGLAGRPTSGELPNGVDVDRFAAVADGEAVRARYGVAPRTAGGGGESGPAGNPLVLFVGSLDRAHYFKGLRVLFEAVRQLGLQAPPVLVVGDGDLRPAYERQATELGLAGRVRFAGWVTDADLPRHYAAADVVVLPSVTRGEAFGVVLLEAMASGKPVIASDLPGVRTVVRAAGGGLLAPPGDAPALARAIAVLAADPRRRTELGRAGRQAVVAHYAWPTIGRRLEAIYRAVLVARGAPPGAPEVPGEPRS